VFPRFEPGSQDSSCNARVKGGFASRRVPNTPLLYAVYSDGAKRWQCHSHAMSGGGISGSCACFVTSGSHKHSYRRRDSIDGTVEDTTRAWVCSKNQRCWRARSTKSHEKITSVDMLRAQLFYAQSRFGVDKVGDRFRVRETCR
jgi:hypothetical protein